MEKLTCDRETAKWRKSSWSGPDGGNCVEVAELAGGRRGVRDSKQVANPVLVFPVTEWQAFVGGLKAGRIA
ncbi:DUF397 domain-containing protein [Sphaerisporangium sp. NPDC051011]|uniref:DUF397 domain-containing protein n=1 Tax=Sphaerisporangium sp. NPDC051011 TaxID=3155792 RepID=UPI0033D90113